MLHNLHDRPLGSRDFYRGGNMAATLRTGTIFGYHLVNPLQACQLSRIFRESHGFTDNLTLSRVGYSNSRSLVVEEDKFAREPYKAKYLKSNVYPDPFASILSCARGRKAFPCCNPSINGAISGRRHPRVTVRRIKGNASTSSSLSVNDITLWMTDAVHKVISLACLHSNRFCLR